MFIKEDNSSAEWQQRLAAAKEEGKVCVYSSAIPEQLQKPLSLAFHRKYGIILELVIDRASNMVKEARKEHKSRPYPFDVFEGGCYSLMDLKPSGLLGESIKADDAISAWRLNPYFPDDKGCIFSYGNCAVGPLINTKLVSLEEQPESWFDLLDARWKGKIAIDDPGRPGAGSNCFSLVKNQIADVNYWHRMALQRPKIARSVARGISLVTKGECAILIGVYGLAAVNAIESGEPVKFIWLAEGQPAAGLAVSLARYAPHPNSARVFVNWFLSAEGQQVWTRAMKLPSSRLDVPQDHILREIQWHPERKVIPVIVKAEDREIAQQISKDFI